MSVNDPSPAQEPTNQKPGSIAPGGDSSQAEPTAQWAPYGEAPAAPTGPTPSSGGAEPTQPASPTPAPQWYEQAGGQPQGSGQGQAYGQQYSGPQGQAYGQQYSAPQGQSYGQPYAQQYSGPQGQTYGQPYSQPQPQGSYPGGGAYLATTQKSMVAAILLAFFLGGLGVHNFYLGFTQKGIVQLVLTIVGWVTTALFVGALVLLAVGVWVIVDIIQIVTRQGQYVADANGVPLQ